MKELILASAIVALTTSLLPAFDSIPGKDFKDTPYCNELVEEFTEDMNTTAHNLFKDNCLLSSIDMLDDDADNLSDEAKDDWIAENCYSLSGAFLPNVEGCEEFTPEWVSWNIQPCSDINPVFKPCTVDYINLKS